MLQHLPHSLHIWNLTERVLTGAGGCWAKVCGVVQLTHLKKRNTKRVCMCSFNAEASAQFCFILAFPGSSWLVYCSSRFVLLFNEENQSRPQWRRGKCGTFVFLLVKMLWFAISKITSEETSTSRFLRFPLS